MVPFENRFHGRKSVSYVYKNGQAIRSSLLTLRYIDNPHRKLSRVSVVVSKKTIKSAVKRNRIRRRIYEYIHPKLSSLNQVYDLIFIVTSGEVHNMPHSDLKDQLDSVIAQANILS